MGEMNGFRDTHGSVDLLVEVGLLELERPERENEEKRVNVSIQDNDFVGKL